MLKKIKDENLKRITILIGVLYLFFLSRRGGDTKNFFSILLMIISIVYIKKNKMEKIKTNQPIYICGTIYILYLSLVFFMSPFNIKYIHTFLNMTLYSVIFFLFCINIELSKKIEKYIFPLIVIFSFGSVYRGIKDVFLHKNILSWYRISGGTYTTVFAAEIGIYLIIGILLLFEYKRWYIKILLIIYININIVLLIFTKSRNTMIMLPLTLGILAVIKYKKKGMLFFFIFFILSFVGIKNSYRIKSFERLTTLSSINEIKQNSRYNIFEEGIEIGKENYKKGVGFCYYREKKILTKKSGYQPHLHNIFIETFATQGIFVLISYILFLYYIFVAIIKNKIRENYYGNRKLIEIYLGIFIFIILYGMSEPVFYFTKIYQLLFLFLTLGIINFKQEDDIK